MFRTFAGNIREPYYIGDGAYRGIFILSPTTNLVGTLTIATHTLETIQWTQRIFKMIKLMLNTAIRFLFGLNIQVTATNIK